MYVVASMTANGIDSKGLAEWGEHSLQGWSFPPFASVGLSRSSLISEPRRPMTAQASGTILMVPPDLPLAAAATKGAGTEHV